MLPLKEFRKLHRLGYSTVCNLGNFTTMYPRSQTILQLLSAVGFEIKLEIKHKHKMRIVG